MVEPLWKKRCAQAAILPVGALRCASPIAGGRRVAWRGARWTVRSIECDTGASTRQAAAAVAPKTCCQPQSSVFAQNRSGAALSDPAHKRKAWLAYCVTAGIRAMTSAQRSVAAVSAAATACERPQRTRRMLHFPTHKSPRAGAVAHAPSFSICDAARMHARARSSSGTACKGLPHPTKH